MSYGAHARRVDADAAGLVEDIDFNKLGMLCKTARGVSGLHEGIYSFGMFEAVCGGYNSSYYGAYIAKTFFDTKNVDTRIELKVASPVATDAVQASGILENNSASSLTLKAGYKNNDDKSAFGSDNLTADSAG